MNNKKIPAGKHLPAYLTLYSQIRKNIIEGIYPYGSKLPSKRNMADQANVSVITVEHAYSLLCDEGYVEARERSGYFIGFRQDDGFEGEIFAGDNFADDNAENAKSTSHGWSEVKNESTGVSDSVDFPISVLAKTMRSVISDLGDQMLQRSPNFGILELREAIKMYLSRSRSITADVDQIIVGAGSEYLYNLIVGLIGREKVFAIESPSYKKIEQVYRSSDVTCELLPLGNDGIESNALRNCQADVLHISPFRSFPSGVTASATKRHEYMRWASTKNRFIVEDDFESEFSLSKKPKETLFAMSDDDNVIYLNTFSKTISPALRVGYMVLPKKLIGEYEKKVGFYSCTVPTYIQYVLAELISNGDFERHINRVRRKKRKELGAKAGAKN